MNEEQKTRKPDRTDQKMESKKNSDVEPFLSLSLVFSRAHDIFHFRVLEKKVSERIKHGLSHLDQRRKRFLLTLTKQNHSQQSVDSRSISLFGHVQHKLVVIPFDVILHVIPEITGDG